MSREIADHQPAPGPAAAWTDAPSRDALQLIAEGVTEVAGFGVAAISAVREDGKLEVMAVAGSDAAREQLEGTRTPVARLMREIEKGDDWGLLRFVPHERLEFGEGDDWGWVPDIPIDESPGAWHPLDLLIAPLYDAEGVLRGTLSIDLPVDGRRPGEQQRTVLNTYAEQAGRAVVLALEREALADQVRMAEAARTIVRSATAQLSLARMFADSREALVEGFRAAGMWLQTFDRDGPGTGAIYSSDGNDITLSPGLVKIAERAAVRAWQEQRVVIVAPDRPFAPTTTEAEGQLVVDFLSEIAVESVLFTPIGAGPECLGNLVLTRAPGAPEWTDAEARTALDIGHDLGRAILNARTFEREHELVEELQELDSYKSQLIATVAHELKNPLTSVLGHLEMLDSAPAAAGPTRASLDAMDRGARRMVRVIDDLLMLAKVGDPANPVITSPVDLHHVVDEAVDLTNVVAVQKQLDVRVHAPDHPVRALGDASEFDRLCANLVSNAVKYTGLGGTVTIDLSYAGPDVVLTVADTGIGISDDDVARLGTEFFRSSNPEAVRQPGTGLGLAIVRRIVERHAGRLAIESALGRGSTFRVTLPAAPPAG